MPNKFIAFCGPHAKSRVENGIEFLVFLIVVIIAVNKAKLSDTAH